MARTRAATYDDQREAILAQAAALFARQGYMATSMNGIAEACGLSKPTLYHYYKDKYDLLVQIAEGHVTKLADLVREVEAQGLAAEPRLRELIGRFVREYAGAQHAHRVLTEDVRFLADGDRQRILDKEREVVAAFAQTLGALRPALKQADLSKPLTMLLFGMINWMFTWLRPDGHLDHEGMAPIVADLFLHGLHGIAVPPDTARPPAAA